MHCKWKHAVVYLQAGHSRLRMERTIMVCLSHVILFYTQMSSFRNAQTNGSVMKRPRWGPTDGWVSIAWQRLESWRMISLTCCIFHANEESTAVNRAGCCLKALGVCVNSVCLEKWLQILMGSENHKSESMCIWDLTHHGVKFRKIGFLTIEFFPSFHSLCSELYVIGKGKLYYNRHNYHSLDVSVFFSYVQKL